MRLLFAPLVAVTAVFAAQPATAQVKPTAILFNGLAQYQPGILTPLAPLAADLRRQGWRVLIDSHLGLQTGDEEPVLLIGHSAGGARAYQFAKKMVEQAKYNPTVITLDAATVWGDVYTCPVANCMNIHTATYPKIPGSYNLSTGKVTDSFVTHVSVPFNGSIRKAILRQTAELMRGGAALTTLASAYNAEPPRAGRSIADIWRSRIGQPRGE